jgi:hypothetical protein
MKNRGVGIFILKKKTKMVHIQQMDRNGKIIDPG